MFRQTFVDKHVRYGNRLRIPRPARPGRMSGYGLPVLGRQIPPSLETNNTVIVESQDGRAVGAGCGQQGADGGLVDLLQPLGLQKRKE